MESSTQTAATDSPARTFSQVVFVDVPQSYPPWASVTCCYTLAASFQPNTRDWVGIFKVGWSTTKDYHTFVWVEPWPGVVGEHSVTMQAVFKDYYLPKDEVEFYQFCYVDSAGQVRGASTPFCFRNPAEQSMENSPEDDLLVITTQEQVEQSVQERAELQRVLDQMMEENETLKSALQKEQQEAASLKEQNEQKEKEISQLVKEMDQAKEQNENLKSTVEQQLNETDHWKEMLSPAEKQIEIQQHNAAEQMKQRSFSLNDASTQGEERYSRALIKIKQLKEERGELRATVDAQSVEISTLNSKVREEERELFKVKNRVELLQVDLLSSEKERERLSADLPRLQSLAHNMDDVKRENQELCRRLSQQETPQTCPDDDLRAQCQTLGCQLRDAEAKLAAEKAESRSAKERVEHLQGELLQLQKQLESVISACEKAERKSSKQGLQLLEAHREIAERDCSITEKEQEIRLVTHEKDELVRENQKLTGVIEGMRRLYAPANSPPTQSNPTSPAAATPTTRERQQQETPEQAENLYETIGSVADPEEELLTCRHCMEVFPLITQEELEQHEQSHRLCPFCTMICDDMEQSEFEGHVYSHDL